LPISAEFLRVRGILQNSVMASDNRTNIAYFGQVWVAAEN